MYDCEEKAIGSDSSVSKETTYLFNLSSVALAHCTHSDDPRYHLTKQVLHGCYQLNKLDSGFKMADPRSVPTEEYTQQTNATLSIKNKVYVVFITA